MSFKSEPTGYNKTALSDLQGSWGNLRDAVIKNFGFLNSDKLLFHINEAMSWESVRNLKEMESTLLLIENIIKQTNSPDEVVEFIYDVRESLNETYEAISEGKAK